MRKQDNWVPVSKATAMFWAYEQRRMQKLDRMPRRGAWWRRDNGQPNRVP